MLLSLHFLSGLAALMSMVAAVPTHGTLNARANIPHDMCDANWLGKSREDGVPWADGAKDHYFCTARWPWGAVIVGIKVWADPTRVTGMQVSYSDGNKSPIIGMQSVDETKSNSLEWGVEERITELRTWRSKDGGAVGKIQITVGNKKTIFVGASNLGKNNVGTGMELHSGMLLAVRGRTNSGPHLETVDFRFMPSNPKRVELKDVKFPGNLEQWNSNKKGIETVGLAEVYIVNTNPEGPNMNKTYRFTNELRKENTHKVESGTDVVFGLKVGGKAGGKIKVPFVTESTTEANGEANFSYTWKDLDSLENKETKVLRWDEAGALSPGKAVRCRSQAMSGHFASDFTSTIETELADGTKVTYEQQGHYDNVGWSSAWSNCQSMDSKDVPKGANVEEAK